MNFTAEGVINLACADITTDIIILTSQCCFISNCLLSLLLFNVSPSNSICCRYTKPALHVSIKCLSVNDFWGLALKKFFFRVSVLLFWITTLLVIHTLFLFAAEYIKRIQLLYFACCVFSPSWCQTPSVPIAIIIFSTSGWIHCKDPLQEHNKYF